MPSAVYLGGVGKGTKGEVISKLIRSSDGVTGIANVGGFRISGGNPLPRLVVLTSNGMRTEWPDKFNCESGVLTYFGDNKKSLDHLNTPRKGNRILSEVFSALTEGRLRREELPIFLHFEKYGRSKDWRFSGQFVPGAPSIPKIEWLRLLKSNLGVPNFCATFQRLGTATITRPWLDDVLLDRNRLARCTVEYKNWVFGETE